MLMTIVCVMIGFSSFAMSEDEGNNHRYYGHLYDHKTMFSDIRTGMTESRMRMDITRGWNEGLVRLSQATGGKRIPGGVTVIVNGETIALGFVSVGKMDTIIATSYVVEHNGKVSTCAWGNVDPGFRWLERDQLTNPDGTKEKFNAKNLGEAYNEPRLALIIMKYHSRTCGNACPMFQFLEEEQDQPRVPPAVSRIPNPDEATNPQPGPQSPGTNIVNSYNTNNYYNTIPTPEGGQMYMQGGYPAGCGPNQGNNLGIGGQLLMAGVGLAVYYLEGGTGGFAGNGAYSYGENYYPHECGHRDQRGKWCQTKVKHYEHQNHEQHQQQHQEYHPPRDHDPHQNNIGHDVGNVTPHTLNQGNDKNTGRVTPHNFNNGDGTTTTTTNTGKVTGHFNNGDGGATTGGAQAQGSQNPAAQKGRTYRSLSPNRQTQGNATNSYTGGQSQGNQQGYASNGSGRRSGGGANFFGGGRNSGSRSGNYNGGGSRSSGGIFGAGGNRIFSGGGRNSGRSSGGGGRSSGGRGGRR